MLREYLLFKTGEFWNCSPEGDKKDCRSGDSFIPNVAELFPEHEECSHPPLPSPGIITPEYPDKGAKTYINVTMMVPFLPEMIGLKKKR
ncbi:hypothetical protein MSSIT_3874 [Methanosarcina siciliae T4/M]|uniref:Uncharacterized protein n=3 Tax=Methanosarcina siciliae TaxID=38027 RepID=A0A0E3PHY7_9EURY|nr:hypothetical protein [Methanosarcina siciliae]AKB30593.1 hypothetical protein MSSIT_3874 [Methanosarcina siciliae T4/M]AKB34487.1 hypothetical protein MSSIH_3797 [Methanosarcina siciliae HI350]